MVFLHFAVQVEQTLLGESGHQVEVTLPGGPMSDGRELMVGGAPYLVEGERVLLHLAIWGDAGTYRLNSWSKGVFREVDGEATMGAERVKLEAIGCEEGTARLPIQTTVNVSSHLDDTELPRVGSASGAGLPWAEAVAAIASCVAEVAR